MMSVGIKEREHMVMDRFQMARREPSRWGSPMPNDIDMHGTSYYCQGGLDQLRVPIGIYIYRQRNLSESTHRSRLVLMPSIMD